VNPSSATALETYYHLSWSDIEKRVADSHQEFQIWSQLPIEKRCEALIAFKNLLLEKRQVLGELISKEMGKPRAQAVAEVEKSATLIDYCVTKAAEVLAPRQEKGFIKAYYPQGVIYGIMPWNFPVWQSLRFCVPALLSGNVALIKPADNVAGSGAMLAEIFQTATRFKSVLQNISIDHATSDKLIADSRIRGVSFTGSTVAGRSIAQIAGKYLKKCVLELGGNDAYVVFADSDVKKVAKKIFDGRILNAGQSCISAKRLLVEASAEEAFLEELDKNLSTIVFGDPLDPKTNLGPVARKDLQQKLQKQLAACVAEGAEIYEQTAVPEQWRQGFYFAPTIVHQVNSDGTAFQDEVFGPVFLVSTFKTEDEAIRLANHSPFGLGGAVFSADTQKALRVAKAMDTGSVAINDFFRSSPERPFGGVKDSGYGRELGPEGFLEFVNLKVIVQDAASGTHAAE